MKETFVSAQQLREFDRSIPTPYHLYHEAGIRRNAARLYDAFSWNQGYKEYYNNLAQSVMDFCQENNIEFYIKKGTITE